MKKQGFSILGIMNDKSLAESIQKRSEEPAMREIPLEKIVRSRANQYRICDIEDLAASIEMFDFHGNLVVRPIQGTDTYELISGERRYEALKTLVNEGQDKFEKVLCKVEDQTNDLLAELELIMANSTARVLTDWEKTYQAGRLEEIFRQLKQSGHKFNGRLREIVADILDVSSSQMGRMESINKNLVTEFKEEFKDGNIGISDAYNLSTIPKEQQKETHEQYKEKGQEAIKGVKKRERNQQTPPPPQHETAPDPERVSFDKNEIAYNLVCIAEAYEKGKDISDIDVAVTCRAAAEIITGG